jgi:hypothetical protein
MSTTNVIKLGTQHVASLEQTRGAKCAQALHLQFPLSTDESSLDVPSDAPTVIRVETRGQTSTATLNMYPISRNSPFGGINPTWADGAPSKFHILHYYKNGTGTDTLKLGWSFTKPTDGSVQGGATDIDVSGISSGGKTLIVIMWDGFTWRTTDWFA